MNSSEKNPYIGPRTFRKQEADLFFGREREARDLLALVASERLVLFYAQSGAGKSSLLNTRLIPNLESKDYEVLPVGRVSGDFSEGQGAGNLFVFNLLRSLVQQGINLDDLVESSLTNFLSKLNSNDEGYFYDDSPIPEIPEGEEYISSRRALIIDQFEELFSTHPEAWGKHADFFSQLAQAMQDDPYLWVVLVMREDYIAALDPYAHLLPGGLRVRYYMQRMGHDAAIRAVEGPAEKGKRPYAEGVAEKLVNDLSSIKVRKPDGTLEIQIGRYVEPVQLQVVCYTLWESLSPNGMQITEEDLKKVGDVNLALGNYYAERVKAVAEAKHLKESKIREWFTDKLISTGGIRNMVLQEPGGKSGGLEDDIVQALHDLVRAEQRGGATFYELTHDRLVEPIIVSNKEWFDKNLSPLQKQAALWNDQGRNEGWLLSDQALAEVEQWAIENPGELTELDKEFLEVCRARQAERREKLEREEARKELEAAKNLMDEQARSAEAERKELEATKKLMDVRARSARRAVRFSIIAAVLMIIAVLASFSAYSDRNTAITKSKQAATESVNAHNQAATAQAASTRAVQQENLAFAGQLAVQSQKTDNNQLSLLLAIEALNQAKLGGKSNLSIAYDVLRRAADQAGVIRLSGATGSVNVVAFSSDGHWLASGSDDGSVLLWDVTSENPAANPLVLGGYTSTIRSLAFSPDAHWLASGSDDSSVLLWNLGASDPTYNPPLSLDGHAGPVYSLVFSFDGHWLASGSDDSTIRLWHMTAKDPTKNPVVLKGHMDYINCLAFSRDGRWLASGSFDKTVGLWNLTAENIATGGIVLSGHTGRVLSVAFGPDSRWLATGSEDGTVRLWDVSAQNPAATPIKLNAKSGVYRVAFSHDNHWLASGNDDSTVQLWNISTGKPQDTPIVLGEHSGPIYSLVFSPDDHWLASGGDDSSIRVWDMTADLQKTNPVLLNGHTGPIYSLAFSLDGRWLASGSADNTAILWDTLTQFDIEFPISQYRTVDRLKAEIKQIKNLAFSPDGFWLASSGSGSDVQLWNFQSGIPTEYWANLKGPVYSLSSDPYGGTLYGGNENGTIYSWTLGTENPMQASLSLANNQSQASTLAICPSGSCWASVSSDNTLSFWYGEGNDYQPVTLNEEQKEIVKSLAISPDGHWLASGSADSTINLWDLTDISKLSSEQPTVLSQSNSAAVTALTFSWDSHWLASAGDDGSLLVWDVSDGIIQNQPYRNFVGEAGAVNALAFSPGGRWLASGSNYPDIKLWDMVRQATHPVILKASDGSVFSLAFSHDGHWLISGGDNNEIRVWGPDLNQLIHQACRTIGRNLEWLEWKSYFNNEDYHTTCPENPFPASVVDHFLYPGDQLARSGDITNAVAKYDEALEKCPELHCPGFKKNFIPDPTARANKQAAQALLDEGDKLAQEGDVDGAIIKYQQALNFDPTVIPDNMTPEARANKSAIGKVLDEIIQLNSDGRYEEAVLKFLDTQTSYSGIVENIDDPSLLNNLCWWGSILGHPSEVKDACEKAVKIDPEYGGRIDSRGLNYALLGEYDLAASDFEFAIDWMKENGFDESYITEREAWIKALKAGQNPFDSATLENLKNE